MSGLSHLPAMMPDLADLDRGLPFFWWDWTRAASIEDLMAANYPGTRFHAKYCHSQLR
jgi:hypothetical protein